MRFLSNRRRYPRRRQKHYKFLHLNLVRALVIMYSCSAIFLGPMPRFVFKFIRISVDGEHIENDENHSVDGKHFIRFQGKTTFSNLSGLAWTVNILKTMKTIVWTENISSVFGAKTAFSNLSGLAWTVNILKTMETIVWTENISPVFGAKTALFKFIRISMDGEHIENEENDSVDGKHFIRFRGENCVFKFIRISMDGEHIENEENDSVDGKHFIRFRGKISVFKFIRNSVDVVLESRYKSEEKTIKKAEIVKLKMLFFNKCILKFPSERPENRRAKIQIMFGTFQ